MSGFVDAVKQLFEATRTAIATDELKPAILEFCDRLSNPIYTETCLNDYSYKSFGKRISESVLKEFDKDDNVFTWTDAAETLMDALAHCSDNAFFPNDENRFLNLYNLASDIRKADNLNLGALSVRVGIEYYSPLAFLSKVAACSNTREFRDVFMNESRSHLSKPVFSGAR